MKATQDIKIGETVLFLPFDLFITYDMAVETPIGKQMLEEKVAERLLESSFMKIQNYFMAAYFLQEQRKPAENQKLAPYRNMLQTHL